MRKYTPMSWEEMKMFVSLTKKVSITPTWHCINIALRFSSTLKPKNIFAKFKYVLDFSTTLLHGETIQ